MNNCNPPRIKKLPAGKQRRLDELLEKNSEGTISPSETAKLRDLVDEAEQLMVENGKSLAEFVRSQKLALPTPAVPVTVWVTPNPAEL